MRPEAGVSLVEVLVTLLVLSIGLLGLAGLQALSVNGQFEADQRSRALLLAEEMAARLRAGSGAVRGGARDPNSPYTAAVPVPHGARDHRDCSDTTPLAVRDLCEWNNLLRGNATSDTSHTRGGGVRAARGCIERLPLSVSGEVRLRVTVAWQGTTPSIAPQHGCAAGSFGAAALRRTVSVDVFLADLVGP